MSELPQPTANPNNPTTNRVFSDFPISEEVLRGVLDMGFEHATPVQAAAIDPFLAGKDLLVRAKTGTGKTAAFAIPIIEMAIDATRQANKPVAIVLEPTRELAQQTAEQSEQIARHTDVSVALIVGGMAMGPQEDALRAGAQVIVGTPGRILDHMRRGTLDASDVQIVCLDEADEMLSMGFFEDVTKIIDKTPSDRQVVFFSATYTDDTKRLGGRYLDEPEEIMLSSDTDGVALIEHIIYETVPGQHKIRALRYLLDIEDPLSAIIFCNTREDTTTVANFLGRQGFDVEHLSGELSQVKRSEVMKKVKRADVRFLVATDVAARGIDISDLSHVVNYSLPQDPAVYLHRTGRTGRIGKRGTAISLVGGMDLATHRALVTRHEIPFITRTLPDAEEAGRLRVARQIKQIDDVGTVLYESYLPLVQTLREHPEGDRLIATALRAFFQWDVRRKLEAEEAANAEPSADAEPAQSSDNTPRGRRRDDRERSGSGGRGGKGSGRDGRRSDSPRRDRSSERPRGGRKTTSGDDLDALLEPSSDGAPPTRTDKPSRAAGGKRSSSPSADAADLDALLEAEPPKKKPSRARSPKKASSKGGDLDDLLVAEPDADLDALLQAE